MDEYRLKVGVSVPIFSAIKKVSEREIIMKKIANLIKVMLNRANMTPTGIIPLVQKWK